MSLVLGLDLLFSFHGPSPGHFPCNPISKAASGDALKVDPKFDSFDNYLKVRRWDTSSLTGGQRYDPT